MARWKLKKGAPRHYIRGVGLVRAGEEFDHAGPPESEHWECLDAPREPVKAKAGKPAKAEVPVPIGPPGISPVPIDPVVDVASTDTADSF